METAELKKALSETRLCKYLTSAEIEVLLTYCKILQFEMGKELLHQGKKTAGIFVILSGTAIMTAKILGAGTLDLGTLQRGDFVGETSLIERTPNTISVTAAQVVQVLFIAGTYFETLALLFPETKYHISKAVAEDVCLRLKELQKKISFYILQSHMIAKSFFGEVMQSLTWPHEIKFEEIGVSHEQFRRLNFFKDLTDDACDTLFKLGAFIATANLCPIIKQGETTSACYIILRGAVQSSIIQDNKYAKLAVLPPLKFFAGSSYIDGSPSVIDFSTCEKTILLKLSDKTLQFLQENHITLWYKIFDELCLSFVSLENSANKLGIRLNSELYNR